MWQLFMSSCPYNVHSDMSSWPTAQPGRILRQVCALFVELLQVHHISFSMHHLSSWYSGYPTFGADHYQWLQKSVTGFFFSKSIICNTAHRCIAYVTCNLIQRQTVIMWIVCTETCGPGQYSYGNDSNPDAGVNCVPCPQGQWKSDTSNAINCTACKPGNTTLTTGSTAASDCFS